MAVEVKDLVKKYGTQSAVDHASFSVNEGEILGFLGPNGAGKSTTMKIATGFIPPTSGTVLLAGYDVRTQSLEVRKNVGYLPEHNPLYLDMYVHEFLHFVGAVHHMPSKVRHHAIRSIVEQCGLGLEQKKKIGALSKGYRQRVGLAQALLHDPKVLILDEPTTGLDPNQILEIRQLIKNVSKKKTVIFSTHIMQEVQALCDRVVVINQGKIVADKRLEDLTKEVGGQSVLKINFSEKIDISMLESIDGVASAEELGEGTFRLTGDDVKKIRSAVLLLASNHGWQLNSLMAEENSLEDIFKQLTQKN